MIAEANLATPTMAATLPLLHRQQPLIQSHPLPYKQKRHQVLEHQNHYTDTYSEANRSNVFPCTVRLVPLLPHVSVPRQSSPQYHKNHQEGLMSTSQVQTSYV